MNNFGRDSKKFNLENVRNENASNNNDSSCQAGTENKISSSESESNLNNHTYKIPGRTPMQYPFLEELSSLLESRNQNSDVKNETSEAEDDNLSQNRSLSECSFRENPADEEAEELGKPTDTNSNKLGQYLFGDEVTKKSEASHPRRSKNLNDTQNSTPLIENESFPELWSTDGSCRERLSETDSHSDDDGRQKRRHGTYHPKRNHIINMRKEEKKGKIVGKFAAAKLSFFSKAFERKNSKLEQQLAIESEEGDEAQNVTSQHLNQGQNKDPSSSANVPSSEQEEIEKERLLKLLDQEQQKRLEANQVLVELQASYANLMGKLAGAENFIDRLRLGQVGLPRCRENNGDHTSCCGWFWNPENWQPRRKARSDMLNYPYYGSAVLPTKSRSTHDGMNSSHRGRTLQRSFEIVSDDRSASPEVMMMECRSEFDPGQRSIEMEENADDQRKVEVSSSGSDHYWLFLQTPVKTSTPHAVRPREDESGDSSEPPIESGNECEIVLSSPSRIFSTQPCISSLMMRANCLQEQVESTRSLLATNDLSMDRAKEIVSYLHACLRGLWIDFEKLQLREEECNELDQFQQLLRNLQGDVALLTTTAVSPRSQKKFNSPRREKLPSRSDDDETKSATNDDVGEKNIPELPSDKHSPRTRFATEKSNERRSRFEQEEGGMGAMKEKRRVKKKLSPRFSPSRESPRRPDDLPLRRTSCEKCDESRRCSHPKRRDSFGFDWSGGQRCCSCRHSEQFSPPRARQSRSFPQVLSAWSQESPSSLQLSEELDRLILDRIRTLTRDRKLSEESGGQCSSGKIENKPMVVRKMNSGTQTATTFRVKSIQTDTPREEAFLPLPEQYYDATALLRNSFMGGITPRAGTSYPMMMGTPAAADSGFADERSIGGARSKSQTNLMNRAGIYVPAAGPSAVTYSVDSALGMTESKASFVSPGSHSTDSAASLKKVEKKEKSRHLPKRDDEAILDERSILRTLNQANKIAMRLKKKSQRLIRSLSPSRST